MPQAEGKLTSGVMVLKPAQLSTTPSIPDLGKAVDFGLFTSIQYGSYGPQGCWETLCQQLPELSASRAKEGCGVEPVTSLQLFSLSLGHYRLPQEESLLIFHLQKA